MSRLLRSTAFRLALAAFFVFNINLRSISSADTFPTRYLPIALLTGHGFQLDQFSFLNDPRYPMPGGGNDGLPYYMQERRGHWMAIVPVMSAVLATPVYVLPVLLGIAEGPAFAPGGVTRTEVVGTALSKLAASLAAAVSVALVFLALLRLTDRRAALWITLAYAFATSTWSVSSQGAWQTTYSGLFLAATALCLLMARDTGLRRHAAAAGTCVALAVACRPTTGILAILLTVYALRHLQRDRLAFLASPVVVGALLLGYNFYYFGTATGGYTPGVLAGYDASPAQIAMGTYGLLLSANRGMLSMSPVLFVAFAGLVHALVRRDDSLLAYLAAAIVATILFYSTYAGWDGGFSFSYRFLADLLPVLVLFMPRVTAWLAASRPRLAAVAVLAAYSVGVQVVGSFYYPCGWYRSRLTDPAAMARIFSWQDSEVMACLRAGPVYPDGLRLLRPRAGRPPEIAPRGGT